MTYPAGRSHDSLWPACWQHCLCLLALQTAHAHLQSHARTEPNQHSHAQLQVMQVQVQQEEDGQGTCVHRLRGGETSPHPNGSSGNGFRDSGQLNKCWRRGCCCRRRWDFLGRCCCGYVRACAPVKFRVCMCGLVACMRDACVNEHTTRPHTNSFLSPPPHSRKSSCCNIPTFGTSQCSCAAGVSPRHPVLSTSLTTQFSSATMQ